MRWSYPQSKCRPRTGSSIHLTTYNGFYCIPDTGRKPCPTIRKRTVTVSIAVKITGNNDGKISERQ